VPLPTDLAETVKVNERVWAAMEDRIISGEVKEMGWFPNGTSG
jgi:hypothetical protein